MTSNRNRDDPDQTIGPTLIRVGSIYEGRGYQLAALPPVQLVPQLKPTGNPLRTGRFATGEPRCGRPRRSSTVWPLVSVT